MAAIHAALTSVAGAGDHIVAAAQVYGGTRSLLKGALASAGVGSTTVDVTDLAAVEAAFTDRTRVLYAETIGNPRLPVADLDALAAIARARGAALMVDATFTPPCALRPLLLGADLSIHSLTKYIGGHSDMTGGVVSGDRDRIEAIRHAMIDTGAVLAPFEAWLGARGLQTLALRWKRICDNALGLARALAANAAVESVVYPGLPEHPQHDLAKRLLGGRFGGMVTFDLAGGQPAGRRFLERVRVCRPAASLGSTKTLVVHPASITHTQLTPQERSDLGIGEGTIRMSVGIEDLPDLIADVEGALA
jgi:cystathionine beta-lyase/cystathionine gamma-synthase